MDANLYVSNNISNNAINEYYDLKRQLTLTKEEQKIYQNYLKERQKTMFDEDLQLKYANYFAPMITAIKHGYESYKDVSNFTNIKLETMYSYFDKFYKYLAKLNLVRPETEKGKRQAVIDFIGSRLLDNGYSEAELSEIKKEPSAQVETPKEPEQNRYSEQSEESNKKPPKTKSKFSFDDPLPKPEEKFPLRNEPLTETEQKVYFKQLEKDLLAQYKPRLKRLNYRQGKLLVRLVDRECDKQTYYIIREFLGKRRAFFWNMFGKFFGVSLKAQWDPEGKDRELEDVCIQVEQGLI